MTVSWHEFSDRAELDHRLAAAAAKALRAQLSARASALLAVSGGSTPKGMFAELSEQAIDWSKVTVTLVDERFVPPDHADSNERLVRENLIRGHAAAASFLPMVSDADIVTAAQACEQALHRQLPCDVLILGMGADGHTASWFPDSNELDLVTDSTNPALVAAVTTPSSPHQRVTMTKTAVMQSEQIVLHITGADKRDVLEANLTGQKQQPISRIVNEPKATVDVYWAP